MQLQLIMSSTGIQPVHLENFPLKLSAATVKQSQNLCIAEAGVAVYEKPAQHEREKFESMMAEFNAIVQINLKLYGEFMPLGLKENGGLLRPNFNKAGDFNGKTLWRKFKAMKQCLWRDYIPLFERHCRLKKSGVSDGKLQALEFRVKFFENENNSKKRKKGNDDDVGNDIDEDDEEGHKRSDNSDAEDNEEDPEALEPSTILVPATPAPATTKGEMPTSFFPSLWIVFVGVSCLSRRPVPLLSLSETSESSTKPTKGKGAKMFSSVDTLDSRAMIRKFGEADRASIRESEDGRGEASSLVAPDARSAAEQRFVKNSDEMVYHIAHLAAQEARQNEIKIVAYSLLKQKKMVTRMQLSTSRRSESCFCFRRSR